MTSLATVADPVLLAVKKLRVNADFEKRKHYNAQDRKRRTHQQLGLPALAATVISASVFVGLADQFPLAAAWFGAACSLFAALLTGGLSFLGVEREAEAHARYGADFLAVERRCTEILTLSDATMLPADTAVRRWRAAEHRYRQLIAAASISAPTSRRDYEKARTSIDEGESRYSSLELGD